MGGVNTIIQANNVTHVARANYRAAVGKTRNHNALEVAKGNFSEYMRTLKNNAQLDAASKEYNWQMEQLSDELRAKQGAGMNTQVQLAAARGALAAQAGYVGVGGSSVDLMDTMVRLQSEMDAETQQNALALMSSRGGKQTAQIMSNAVSSMDMSRTFGQFDYQQHIEPKRMKSRFGKLVMVAVATYFGGPMAGEAVADAFVSSWKSSNGDFQGASEQMGQAVSGMMGAAKSYSQRGGKSWASSAFNYNDGTGPQQKSGGKANITQFGNNMDNFQNYSTSTGGLGWFY